MTDLNYLQMMHKVEVVIGLNYGDKRIAAMKEYLADISDNEWPGVVKRVLENCKTLPTVAEFYRYKNKLW